MELTQYITRAIAASGLVLSIGGCAELTYYHPPTTTSTGAPSPAYLGTAERKQVEFDKKRYEDIDNHVINSNGLYTPPENYHAPKPQKPCKPKHR